MAPVPLRPGAPVVQLRNVMAHFLVRLFHLAIDKRDLHFLQLVTKHDDHHLSARSQVTCQMWQSRLKQR